MYSLKSIIFGDLIHKLLYIYQLNANKMIERSIENHLKTRLFKGKAILIFGSRQVGKTTLLKKIIQDQTLPTLWLSGDEPDIRLALTNTTSTQLRGLIGQAKIVVIDEAQRIENIGLTIKLATDNFSDIQIIATGSSAFELANKINEPLTGRKFEYFLFPFSFDELAKKNGIIEEKRMLERRLIFGSYPEVVNQVGNEKEILNLLTNSYLYKDLLEYEGIKKSSLLSKILRALALQLGSEVSYNEVSQIVGADKNTVEKYIDLLEQAFVLFRLNAFSRNVRNELKKSKKIYFYDNGIRNAIIGNFQLLGNRTDVRALWENYLMAERMKVRKYNQAYGETYFWRTAQQQEIDYLEEKDGLINAFEFKWNSKERVRFPKTFIEAYPNSTLTTVNPSNYNDFLASEEG